MRGVIVLALVAGLVAAMWGFSGHRDPMDPDAIAHLAFLAVLASFVGWGLFSGGQRDVRRDVRNLLFWVAALVVVAGLYAFKDDFGGIVSRVRGELTPGAAIQSAPGEYTVTRSRGGMFLINGEANGRPVRFIFDTGASGISLSAADARAAGLMPAESDYSVEIYTANGITRVAPARLETLTIGGITMHNVRVTVSRPGALSRSLLGHTFLDRLSSYEVRGDRLILRGQ